MDQPFETSAEGTIELQLSRPEPEHCPLCDGVVGTERWITAREGLVESAFAPKPGELPDKVVWGLTVRFHDGHFRQRIESRIYRLTWPAASAAVTSSV